MAPIEQLELIAEISAAFLGFIAIFIALSNEDGRFSASDRHFIQSLVLVSSFAICLSFVPQTLFSYFAEDAAWHYSLMVFISGWLLIGILIGWEQWHMPQEEAEKVNVMWHMPPWSLAFAMSAFVLHALYTGENFRQAYVSAVTLTIPQNLWCFIAIVFRRFF
ncbi:MAG: hypothetical protein ACJA1Q_000248 [Pseudohongiellaceae bacterium]